MIYISKRHTGKKNAAFRATINALSIYKLSLIHI